MQPSDIATALPAWSALPFAGLLLSIALCPLLTPIFWHHHFPKITAAWAGAMLVPFVIAFGAAAVHELAHMVIADYVPFLILLAALFTIGGGIHMKGALRGSPGVNVTIIAIGTLLASCVGTTGAAMITIRPLLRANAGREHRAHTIVFFIFLVANAGGVLTPLGDPPLFLGFLHGVPFFWTLRLWGELLAVAGIVLTAYWIVDRRYWNQDPLSRATPSAGPRQRLRLEGRINLVFLAATLVAVILSGVVDGGEVMLLGVHQSVANLARDACLLCMVAGSWAMTPRVVREENGFTWGPIREVAILFAGIFVTMLPALAMLRAGEAGAMAFVVAAVREPAHFFWASGILSSFLDNAPTYLTLLSTALGRLHPGVPEHEAVARLLEQHPHYLAAISAGSVFMGANTYIGNAPNFMVKSIAEEAGVKMPSFFGYILGYSLPVLIPTFVLVTWLFFG